MHTRSIERIHKRVATDKLHTYCFMNKQYVKVVQKQVKAYLRLMNSKNYTVLTV